MNDFYMEKKTNVNKDENSSLKRALCFRTKLTGLSFHGNSKILVNEDVYYVGSESLRALREDE